MAMSDHTPGPYIIGQPGGPAGPFWSIVNQGGQVVAMQITSEANAHAIVAALNSWNRYTPTEPEPDWSQAPAWARIAVVSSELDNWLWLESPLEPEFQPDGWGWGWYPTCRWDIGPTVDLPVGVDWRTTLRQRPEVQP